MSRLAKYLKSEKDARQVKGYGQKGFSTFDIDPYMTVFFLLILLVGGFYFYKIKTADYFKGAEFPSIGEFESKFNTVVNDYSKFQIDSSYYDFIKAVKYNHKVEALEIARKYNNNSLLGIYESIYGNPDRAIAILKKEYKDKQNPEYLHHLLYSFSRKGDIGSMRVYVDKAVEIKPETYLVYATSLEEKGFLKDAYKAYKEALSKTESNELKNKLVVKTKLLEKYLKSRGLL